MTTSTISASECEAVPVTTLIFDVDDTLYDVSTGFTAHRNGGAVQQFMVDYLYFPDLASAKVVRDAYFERYHATLKALKVAEDEGAFPPVPTHIVDAKTPRFDPQDLSEYWATRLNFDLLGPPKLQVLQDLQECPLQCIAFSNGPRKYVKRVLQHLGLFDIFGEEGLFAVDDVLPACKPEKEAFDKVLAAVGITSAAQCVMVEDSMKNIRQSRALGMRTILVAGQGRLRGHSSSTTTSGGTLLAEQQALAAEATKPGDAPVHDDPAVDVVIETIEDLRTAVPTLWDKVTPTFPVRKI